MTEQTTDEAVARKVFDYGIFEATRQVVLLDGAAPADIREANQAKADYLREEIPGNNNPYVAWADPALDFQCPTCNEIITAKQEHPLHPEDKALLEEYPARLDNVM